MFYAFCYLLNPDIFLNNPHELDAMNQTFQDGIEEMRNKAFKDNLEGTKYKITVEKHLKSPGGLKKMLSEEAAGVFIPFNSKPLIVLLDLGQ